MPNTLPGEWTKSCLTRYQGNGLNRCLTRYQGNGLNDA